MIDVTNGRTRSGGGEWRWKLAELDRASPARVAALLYAAAVLVLLCAGFLNHYRAAPGLLEADEREYFDLATQIMAGQWPLSPRRTLAFPLLVAGVREINDSFLLLQVTVSATYALSIPMLFLLVRKLTQSTAAGLIAGAVLAVWPPAVFFGTSLYSEAAVLPVFLASLWLLPQGSRDRATGTGARRAVAAGAVLGLAAHVRPMYLLFLPMLVPILLAEERRVRAAALRFCGVLAGFGLVVLPWSAYVSTRFHRPIVLTSNGGETLAGGLTPVLLQPSAQRRFQVTGRTTWAGPGKWVTIRENGYLSPAELRRPYTEIDPLLQRRALGWAAAHPRDAAWLEYCKLAYMWAFYPLAGDDAGQLLLGDLPTLALLALSLALLALMPAARWRYARLWMLALFVSGVALISWGSWRFRQPADAGLIGFCAAALYDRDRRRREPAG